jgi:hypothetical protein
MDCKYDDMVRLYGINDSNDESIDEYISRFDLIEFIRLFLDQVNKFDDLNRCWDLYEISKKIFGDKEHYYILSPVLHEYDGGSFFGRVGFFYDGRVEQDEAVARLHELLARLTEPESRKATSHTVIKFGLSLSYFNIMNWNLTDGGIYTKIK